jgi:CRP-like cAMP-binding protein
MTRTDDLAALRGNRLLALLDDETLAALAPDLTRVALKVPEILLAEGKPIRQAYFPTEGVISMLAAVEGGLSKIEVGTVGNEGMVGLPLFLGASRAPGDCFSQVRGEAWRIPAAAFRRASEDHPALAKVLHRYTQALLVQVSQSTACNRVHAPIQRCARWLLMTGDRVRGDTFDLTQEFLGQMLGERRPTVSRVASELQSRGMISYSRGRIALLDRRRLEETACPCYRIVRSEYDSMLAQPPATRSLRKG